MENSENAVRPCQRVFLYLRECLSQRRIELGLRTAAVIASSGYFGRVAEWQTRWLQVPVSFGTWGFKSPFAHRCLGTSCTCVLGHRSRFGLWLIVLGWVELEFSE